MWISYAGRDSSELVEAVVEQLKTQSPDLPVNRYKKRINVLDHLSVDKQDTDSKRADDDWPVLEAENPSSQEEFHLLPMDDLFELVVEIAFSSRTLVVLSPAYFLSEPCMRELAAIIGLESRPLPLFVLNGLTHQQIADGKFTVKAERKHNTIDVVARLLAVRSDMPELDKIGCFEKLTQEDATHFLHRIVKHNVPQVEQHSLSKTVDSDLTRQDLIQLGESSDISKAADTIANAVKAHFVDRPGLPNYCQRLQQADRDRFERWFDTKFGKLLLEQVNKDTEQNLTAKDLVQTLMIDPNELQEHITDALRVMNINRCEPSSGDLGKFENKDAWNNCVSELAGLYTLTLLDYESLISLTGSSSSDLCFVIFSKSNFQPAFQACIVNSSVQDSVLRVRPADTNSVSGTPIVPEFSMFETDPSAGSGTETFEREFVEALFQHVCRKSSLNCPKSDPKHSTLMNDAERQQLRGQIKRFQRTHGPGSLVLTINRSAITAGQNWWDEWDRVHTALNDGAAPHARVRLRGIVINQRDDTATIQMHPDYEERLDYIRELLDDYYLL